MSRVVKIWVEAKVGYLRHRQPNHIGIPLYIHPDFDSRIIGWVRPGGVLAYFVGFYDDPVYRDRIWLRLIYQDQVGWVSLKYVLKLKEIDELPSGELEEKQVYPTEEED